MESNSSESVLKKFQSTEKKFNGNKSSDILFVVGGADPITENVVSSEKIRLKVFIVVQFIFSTDFGLTFRQTKIHFITFLFLIRLIVLLNQKFGAYYLKVYLNLDYHPLGEWHSSTYENYGLLLLLAWF